MFTDLWPALAIMGIVLSIPLLVLRATRKREDYCGNKLRHCFWCGEKCEYYRLEKEGN